MLLCFEPQLVCNRHSIFILLLNLTILCDVGTTVSILQIKKLRLKEVTESACHSVHRKQDLNPNLVDSRA